MSEHEHDDMIQKVSERAEDIDEKLRKQKPLRQVLDSATLMLAMVVDYFRGRYREIPYWAISAGALALVYVLNPMDVIPDVIPGLGYLDDATVVAFCLKLIDKELAKYKAWRDQQRGMVDPGADI